jgi:N-acetylated-alpha-linked acidic dipeptidase
MEVSMRVPRALLALGGAFAFLAPAASTADKPLLGFGDAAAAEERDLEKRFDASLDASNLRAWMKRLAARPHHVGSPYGRENAEFIAAQFKSWGYDTAIEEFRVLFPTPRTRVLEMTAPTRFRASIAEPPLEQDATSGQAAEQLPVYNAYSIDGDVEGLLVYVNYGVPKDYEELARRGVDVKGKIAIARYGGSWRGIKPKVAAEHGAIGCLIYSDPKDDGYFEGDVYPKGAWRNERSAQRGSVADMPLYPGDPLTPGVGATADARRLDRKEAATLTKIPVMPISYADARPLLAALEGPLAPETWRGALPITYHLGPGPAKVHLKLEFDWKLTPAYDVVAKLAGNERPDQWILRGNHHDGWVNGADDPTSGMVALMEEARGVSLLAKGGWRPKRTIVYLAWDGEEPGLLGSTEWAETHAEELEKKAAVYINSDSNARGFLYVGGSHTLEPLVNEAARDVTDPQKKVSVLERARAARILGRRSLDSPPEDRREARERADLRIAALGSGSDYTPFLQHLGISSLNVGFGGEGEGGSYHSIYDSIDHYTRFIDPTFEYGVALAQTAGRLTLRLANADVLPLDFTAFAETVSRYAKEVQKLADDLREETEEENRRVRDKTYELAADPKEAFVAPGARDPVPFVNFAPLQNAVARLQQSAGQYKKAAAARAASATPLTPDAQKTLDGVLLGAERTLTRPEGLPGRPWFRHQVYAPGFYTGYGVKTLPGVREALELRKWDEAGAQAAIVARHLEAFAREIDRATALTKVD